MSIRSPSQNRARSQAVVRAFALFLSITLVLLCHITPAAFDGVGRVGSGGIGAFHHSKKVSEDTHSLESSEASEAQSPMTRDPIQERGPVRPRRGRM
jgi:hypothetical protein